MNRDTARRCASAFNNIKVLDSVNIKQVRGAPPGFSLIELLVVMAIAGALIGLSGMATAAVYQSWRQAQAVGTVKGRLDLARQAAVANQTRSWVGLGENGNTLCLGIFVSLNGEPLTGAINPLSPGSSVRMLEGLARLDQFALASSAEINDRLSEQSLSPGKTLAVSATTFQWSSQGANVTLDRIIEFNALGELVNADLSAELTDLGIKSITRGRVSVVRIHPVTGQTTFLP